MKPAKFLMLSAIVFCTGCTGEITPVTSLVRDQYAKRLVKQEKIESALEQYLNILESSPREPAVHSNIGVLLLSTGKPDDALKSLQFALKIAEEKKDFSSQFAIRYNMGVYYGLLKKVPEALENYQAALEIAPSSEVTKHNIELLIQQQQQQGGEGEGKENDQQQQAGKDQDKKNQEGNDNKKDEEKEDKQYGEQKPKYKPRPYQGDQLSEGDVKKILGELKNQEQKIRANFDKKERKDSKNEKDW